MVRSFRSFVVAASVISALGISGASAADMPVKAQPVPYPTVTWTGWYVGAAVGYAWGDVTLGTPSNPNASGLNPSGGLVVLNAGYDYQFANRWVLGARLSVPILGVDDTTFSPIAGTNITGETKIAVLLTGRLGYSMGNFLPYVFAGGVWARGEASNSGVGGLSAEADHTGYIVGFGVETYIARNWTLDLNYSYSSVSKENYTAGGFTVAYGMDTSAVTLGVNYRF